MANLSTADLRRANLRRANLLGANLLGANLLGAFIDDRQRIDLSETRNWREARWDDDVYRVLIERYGDQE